VIVANDPDVIALQEVRLDSAFICPYDDHSIAHWYNTSMLKEDAGSQVEHLLSHLAQARTRALARVAADPENASAGSTDEQLPPSGSNPYYQFVYQPAMSMVDT
jgi:hypothetical protein